MTSSTISLQEKKRYLLKEKRDFQILHLIHDLDKKKEYLSEEEKLLLLFCRTQLEDDWRKPLFDLLRVFKKQVQKRPNKNSKERMKALSQFAKKHFWQPRRSNK